MSRLFQKPANISFDNIEKYINSYDGNNDLLLFKYIYLLSKKYLIDLKFKISSNEELDLTSIKCATKIFNEVSNNKNNLNFKDIFDKVSIDILNDLKSDELYNDQSDFFFKNYILSKIESVSFNGFSDISNFSEYIYEFMKKLPKKKNSSEWFNLYKSVLLSFFKTIDFYEEDLFDYNIIIHPKIELYNLDSINRDYVSIIVLQLVYNLRDSFNKITSSKVENIFTLHFKEILNGN